VNHPVYARVYEILQYRRFVGIILDNFFVKICTSQQKHSAKLRVKKLSKKEKPSLKVVI